MSIGKRESLGRGVTGRKAAMRARRQRKGSINDFVPTVGSAEISHDRLSIADRQHMLRIAKERGASNGRMFRGWAVVIAEDIATAERILVESPTPANPYHADIKLTDDCAVSRDCQKKQAQVLADNSRWVEPDAYERDGA